jgi:hypothetical protein
MWPEKQAAWSNATGIEQFERLFWQSVKEKDWTEVDRHLAAGYVEQVGSETLNHDQALARFHQFDISDLSFSDISIQPSGDTAVITYGLTLHGSLAGQPLALENARMMTVWQQQKRGWMAIAHSAPAEKM